jgi:hypothetical protein
MYLIFTTISSTRMLNEGYSWNASCVLNLISTFLVKKIEEAIKIEQSKDTVNIGHNTKNKKRSNTYPTKQTDGVL